MRVNCRSARLWTLALLIVFLAPPLARAEEPAGDRYVIPENILVEETTGSSFSGSAWHKKAVAEEARGNWREAASAWALILSRSQPSHVVSVSDGAGRGPTRRYVGLAHVAAEGLRRCYARDPAGVFPFIDPSVQTEVARAIRAGDVRAVTAALVRTPVGPDADRGLAWLATEAESRGDTTRAADAWMRLLTGAGVESRRRLPPSAVTARIARLDDEASVLSPATRLLLIDASLRRAASLCGAWGGSGFSALEAITFGVPVAGSSRSARDLAAESASRHPRRRHSAGTPYGPGPLHRAEGPAWRPVPDQLRVGSLPGATEWIRSAGDDEESLRFIAPVITIGSGDLVDAALVASLDVPWHPFCAKGRGWFVTESAALPMDCATATPVPWRVRAGLGGPSRPHLNHPFAGAWAGSPPGGTWIVPLVVGSIPLTAVGAALPGRSPVEPPSISRIALVAVDPATEGRIRWSTEYVTDTRSRACYDEVTFASPPMVSGRTVYIGALVVRQEVESRLCAIDADTGLLRWQTTLATRPYGVNVGWGGGFAVGSPVPSGLIPAGAGDTVVYATNLGAVAACDTLTGQVRWLVLLGSERAHRQRLAEGGATWGNNPPLLVGPNVFLTTQDSDLGFVLDRGSGRLVDAFSTRSAGGSPALGGSGGALYRYMVADGRGRVALSGSALRIVDGGGEVPGGNGDVAGPSRRLDDPAIGRGYWHRGIYYFPASGGLMAYDMHDQQAGVVRIMEWERPTDSPCEVVAGPGWGIVVWRTSVWTVPLR